MKTLQLEDATARQLYNNASAELKVILEESFGKPFFSQKITDRIKTWQDVVLALPYKLFLPYENPSNKFERAINANVKIQKIAEVLNEGWSANFDNKNEYKYYPYFEKKSSGWFFSNVSFSDDYASMGFGLYFKSSELAKYAGEQFIEIYREYLP